MSLAFPVLVALVLGLLFGGRLHRLADLSLRHTWLLFAALALQIAAFPFAVLPWQTGDREARWLWIASFFLLLAASVVNRSVAGVPIVASGLAANAAAVAANGGTMPVLPDAMRAAGDDYVSQANSTALARPHLAPLVDRWAAPDWIPFANVFSVGDVVIALGAMVVVLAGMGVRPRVPLAVGRPS